MPDPKAELAAKVLKERSFFHRTREIGVKHDPQSLNIWNQTFRYVMHERNDLPAS